MYKKILLILLSLIILATGCGKKENKNEPEKEEKEENVIVDQKVDIINLDLPRKVRYKKRKKNNLNIPKKDTKIRINHTYENFKDYVKNYNDNNFNISIVEMDTVKGAKGESLLLTLLWRQANFMLAYKIKNKETNSVNNFFMKLKELLGYEKFHELFPIILTDNGVEFCKPDVI